MNKYLELLRTINGGNVFFEDEGPYVVKNIVGENIVLCSDPRDAKNYFFAKYNFTGETDNMLEIEDNTTNNMELFDGKRPNPSDSYLILFWQVPEINEGVLAKVVEIEENEFFYKKYVIYFTKEELDEFNNWIEEQSYVDITKILKAISDEKDKISSKFQFALRIFSKIPFYYFDFQQDELKGVEDLVSQRIKGLSSEVNELYNYLEELLITDLNVSDELIDEMYEKYVMG